ncbi:MAG: hypothetical protein CMO43_03815 [Verrucomicrobiales bacterium]|nr:hypothetical protein [Verrucomicrobiales bacterium]
MGGRLRAGSPGSAGSIQLARRAAVGQGNAAWPGVAGLSASAGSGAWGGIVCFAGGQRGGGAGGVPALGQAAGGAGGSSGSAAADAQNGAVGQATGRPALPNAMAARAPRRRHR